MLKQYDFGNQDIFVENFEKMIISGLDGFRRLKDTLPMRASIAQ